MKITDMRRLVAEATETPQVKVEEEQLDEVKMSPGVFAKWASSSEAQGIRAGFEAEMIFRDTRGDEEDEEYEPDYDYDERTRSIDDIIDFFTSGEGLGRAGGNRLRAELQEEYTEWRSEKIADKWYEEKDEQIRDYMELNVWDDKNERNERIREKLEENDVDNPDEVIKAGEKKDKENELYKLYQDAYASAREDFDAEVQDTIDNEDGDYYDSAREYWEEMMYDGDDFDEEEWLNDIGYDYMSDVSNDRSIDWPYYRGGQTRGERDWNDIGDSLRRIIPNGHEVKVGGGYHSTARKDKRWIIEPDGSLDADGDEDTGLEIVSPPMPLLQAVESLEAVINWGNEFADAYTNSSTGLHMGISLPFKGGDVDYVKLILFMGDQYVLEKFERTGNTYCASALEKLKQTQRARQQGKREPEKTASALELIQKNLIELAQRYVQDGVGVQKYTSAHIKDGYIEFRSPGGDYLSMDSRGEMASIKDTMLRFAYSMYLAGRPDLERQEYAKKLYKLLGAEKNDALKLFAEYSAGTLSQDELKVQWAKQVLAKEAPDLDLEVYEVYNSDTGQVYGTIKAKDYSAALEQLRNNYRDHDDWQSMDLKRFRGNPEDLIDKDKLSNRARIAQQINTQPKLYRVSSPSGTTIDVVARSEQEAKDVAAQKDEHFHRNRSYITVKVLTTKSQARDNNKDAADVQTRVTGNETGRWEIISPDGGLIRHVTGTRDDAETARQQVLFRYPNPEEVTIRPISATSHASSAPRSTFEVYNVNDPERVLDTLRNVTAEEVRAYIQRHEESGEIRPGVLRVRMVVPTESVDAGQLDKPTLTPVEIMRKHGMSEQELVRQIKLGVKVELEHTTDARTAIEIALDHINEVPDYYDRLQKVEK